MAAQIRRNKVLNQDRFEAEEMAVWDTEDVIFPFREIPQPAGSHLVTGSPSDCGDGGSTIPVRTTTVDSIVSRHSHGSELVIIKLDVEDAEIPALRGASSTLSSRDVLLIYEDHGADQACSVTRFVIDELQMNVVYPMVDGTAASVSTETEARAFKEDPHKGYNFVAYSPRGAFANLLGGIRNDA
jgi:FkbM family methyltransferase